MAAATNHISSLSEQEKYLDDEQLILVDEKDIPSGAVASKRYCHRIENITAGRCLHRAFSVFLFDTSAPELLLQRRSASKITFPLLWTNTCCSHPLANKEEMESSLGVLRACRRKLVHELGIPLEQIPFERLIIVTKVLYQAPCPGTQWGEHEVDTIVLMQSNVTTKLNPDEVVDARYFTLEEVKMILADSQPQFRLTPWFERIARAGLLFKWWEAIMRGNLSTVQEKDTVHRL